MKLAEYLARRRRARVAAVMLFAPRYGVCICCAAGRHRMSGAGSYPGTGHFDALPAVSALAQEQQEPAAQPLPEKWVCLTFDDRPQQDHTGCSAR